MSQIGFVKQEERTFKKAGEADKTVKWLECHFRVGGMRPFTAKMSKNKKKEDGSNQPDFYIYLRANVNKGDRFRDIRIGALWVKKKVFDGVEKTFMTGNIFMDVREIPITVWKAEPRFEGEVIEYLYDISMMKNKAKEESADEDGGYTVEYTDADIPAVDPNEEIPF